MVNRIINRLICGYLLKGFTKLKGIVFYISESKVNFVINDFVFLPDRKYSCLISYLKLDFII